LRTSALTQVRLDEQTVVLRLLCDRRDELARTRTQTVNRLHRLLTELIPVARREFYPPCRPRPCWPRYVAGRTRRQLASDLITEITVLDRKLKASDARLHEAVTATGSGLMQLYGTGPAGAARLLGDVGNVARFDMPVRAYSRRRLAEGGTPMEALRCLKCSLSNVVYRQMAAEAAKASPGGQAGATTTSSAADPIPTTSEQLQLRPAHSAYRPVGHRGARVKGGERAAVKRRKAPLRLPDGPRRLGAAPPQPQAHNRPRRLS
jgi:hypothetical protein